MIREGWETAVVVASGPSLTAEQCNFAREVRRQGRCRIVVVNDCWRLATDADTLYACDKKWWRAHIAAVRRGFAGELWTQDHKASVEFGLNWIEPVRGNHLLPHGDHRITLGSNSGFQAIMLARLFGARHIVLIGFDMKVGPKGEQHWFGSHPAPLSFGNPRTFVGHYNAVAPALALEGTRVTNATISSSLDCFPRATLQDALA